MSDESQAVQASRTTQPAVNGSEEAFQWESEGRPCACGCGALVYAEHGRKYVDSGHRLRAWAKRHPVEQRVLPGQSKVERDFSKWIDSPAGRYVEREVVRLARELRAAGLTRYGIKGIWERMRWDLAMGIPAGSKAEWKLDNRYPSLLARRIMAQCPDLAGFFEIRDLRGRP